MISKNFAGLLQRHPQLKNSLSEGRFLTGYTDGSSDGKTVSVFVFRCSWHHFCIQATAGESLPAGEVLIVTDNNLWNLSCEWKAYRLKDEKTSSMKSNSLNHNPHRSHSRLASLAV